MLHTILHIAEISVSSPAVCSATDGQVLSFRHTDGGRIVQMISVSDDVELNVS